MNRRSISISPLGSHPFFTNGADAVASPAASTTRFAGANRYFGYFFFFYAFAAAGGTSM